MCVKCRLDRELSAGRKRIPQKGNLRFLRYIGRIPLQRKIDGAACFMCSRFTPAKSVCENLMTEHVLAQGSRVRA